MFLFSLFFLLPLFFNSLQHVSPTFFVPHFFVPPIFFEILTMFLPFQSPPKPIFVFTRSHLALASARYSAARPPPPTHPSSRYTTFKKVVVEYVVFRSKGWVWGGESCRAALCLGGEALVTVYSVFIFNLNI